MSESQLGYVCSFLLGAFLIGLFVCSFPKGSSPYIDGVADTHKEAFKQGLMTKEITADDKVIYRWIETHKLGYENQ